MTLHTLLILAGIYIGQVYLCLAIVNAFIKQTFGYYNPKAIRSFSALIAVTSLLPFGFIIPWYTASVGPDFSFKD